MISTGIILLGNVIYTLAEFVQLYGQGPHEYFTNYENIFENAQIIMTYVFCFYSFAHGLDTLHYDNDFSNVLAITVLVSVVRLSRIISYFENFRPWFLN